MNEKIDEVLKAYDQQIKESQIATDSAKLGQSQQELQLMENQNVMNSINEQLDLGDVLDRMHNLLRGYVLKKVDGVTQWCKPKNNDLVVLSDYGVSYIMQMLQAYLTKNTLLSNYDDKQIDAKMEDFSNTINDDIFMEYDKMFLEPTLDECKEEIKRRIQSKVQMRKFALELMDKEADENKIETELLKEMEGRIEKELNTIKDQKRKNKLKRFESITRMIQDTVHSAYQRAWKGQERTSARSHMHITETKGGVVMPQQNSGFNPLGILKRR